MDLVFSKHAQEQMQRRNINYEHVLSTVLQPEQVVEDTGIVICQSIIKENEQMFLLRVFVNKDKYPNVIVTLYKTTKILKYYES
jgi:hypothetical protein